MFGWVALKERLHRRARSLRGRTMERVLQRQDPKMKQKGLTPTFPSTPQTTEYRYFEKVPLRLSLRPATIETFITLAKSKAAISYVKIKMNLFLSINMLRMNA